MIVDFKRGDAALLVGGLTLYTKACESASKACEKIGLTLIAPLAQAQGAADHALELVQGWIEETAEAPLEADLALETRDAMQRGLWLALEQMTKLAVGQVKLGIAADDTRAQQDHARALVDRLRGQTDLGLDGIDSVTFSAPGHDPVTMSGATFSRLAADTPKMPKPGKGRTLDADGIASIRGAAETGV